MKMAKQIKEEGPLIISSCGVIFSWITTEIGTVYFAPVKKLEKMFKIKIKPKSGDMELGETPRFYRNNKWNYLLANQEKE